MFLLKYNDSEKSIQSLCKKKWGLDIVRKHKQIKKKERN